MQGAQALLQLRVYALRGLDQQQDLVILMYGTLPSIHGNQPGNEIDAGCQLLIYQQVGDSSRLLAIRDSTQYHERIDRHAGNIPEPGSDRQAAPVSETPLIRYVAPMPAVPFMFLLFLCVPLLEIWLLIKVGGVIGALPTVALVVLTAVIGATLARRQGLATLARLQATLARGEAPAMEMLEGVILLIGAFLLLTPGFFTDALGFACLVPPVRRALVRLAVRRFTVVTPPPGAPGGTHQPRTIEGEYRRED
jgi:UPF0716 protein FxsA